MKSQFWWYTARSGGIVAWVLLAAAVVWGLALSTKVFGKRPRPNWLLDLHRFLGAAAVVFTAVHVTSIVLDSYVRFGLIEILVPFTGRWHPVAVAWGIIGFYLLLAIEITSLLRKRVSKSAWRATHYSSFPLFVLATVHALAAGTDRRTVLLRLSFLVCMAAVAVLTLVRLQQAESHDLMTAPRPGGPPRSRLTPQ